MRISKPLAALAVVLSVVCLFQVCSALVVGIDLGSDSFKVVMVRPGSIDIVLNEGSGRKTASAVGYSSHGRMFGDLAQQLVRGSFFGALSQHELSRVFFSFQCVHVTTSNPSLLDLFALVYEKSSTRLQCHHSGSRSRRSFFGRSMDSRFGDWRSSSLLVEERYHF